MSVPVKDQLGDLVMAQQQELAIRQAHIDRLKDNVKKLLSVVALNSRPCHHCGFPIWVIYIQKTDKKLAYEGDGTPHEIRCSKEREVKRDRK